MADARELQLLANALSASGCPADRTPLLASQLIKRAEQLSSTTGRTREEALAHLLGLIRQGWAANGAGAEADGLPPSKSIEPWPTAGSREVGDFRIFKVRSVERVSPRTGATHSFYVIDAPHWVNVVAITPDEQMVLVEQYRHGTCTVDLEIPGGVMDPEDASPVATGVRELREETGFEGEGASLLGEVAANPAIMNNTCYTVLVTGCQRRHALELDGGEDLATRVMPVAEVRRRLLAGEIKHSLIVAALHQFFAKHSA